MLLPVEYAIVLKYRRCRESCGEEETEERNCEGKKQKDNKVSGIYESLGV